MKFAFKCIEMKCWCIGCMHQHHHHLHHQLCSNNQKTISLLEWIKTRILNQRLREWNKTTSSNVHLVTNPARPGQDRHWLVFMQLNETNNKNQAIAIINMVKSWFQLYCYLSSCCGSCTAHSVFLLVYRHKQAI